MKSLSTVLFLLFFNSIVYGELNYEMNPKYIDLGKLEKEDSVIVKKIEVLNKDKENISIKFVGGTCGCTTVKKYDKIIKPKKKGLIEIEVHPLSKGKGLKSQQLFFEITGLKKEIATLEVSWFLKLSDIEISPLNIELELSRNEIENNLGKSKNTIVILDAWKEKLEITDIKTSANLSACFYDMSYMCHNGSKTHVCRFETSLSPQINGELNEWLSFKTNHPDYRKINIPITGKVRSLITATPRMLVFSKQGLEKKIVKLNSLTEYIEINSIKTSNDKIKTTTIGNSEKSIELEISYDNTYGHKESKLKQESVDIVFDSPSNESLEIKVLIL